MGDERPAERAAVARLQHRHLDLDEAVRIEVVPNRAHHLRAQQEGLARLLVHQQIQVAAAIALLDVRQAVERVGQRRADAREQHELVDDQRRLAAAALRRLADRADDVAEVDVDLARARLRAEQLDPAAAVDEVEEDELPHVAARQHAPGQAALLGAFDAVLERVRLGADAGDLVAVREPLRWRGHEGLTIAQALGPVFRRVPHPLDREAVRLVEVEVRLVVRQQHGGQPGARRRTEARLEQRRADALALRRRVDADARRGTSAARRPCPRASARRRVRTRGTAPSRCRA